MRRITAQVNAARTPSLVLPRANGSGPRPAEIVLLLDDG
jgi:hypothetical protein